MKFYIIDFMGLQIKHMFKTGLSLCGQFSSRYYLYININMVMITVNNNNIKMFVYLSKELHKII